MKKIFFDEKLQSEFWRKGYVAVPLLSAEETERLSKEIEKLRPADNFAPGSGDGQARAFHTTILDADLEFKRKAASLVRNFFSARLADILADYRIMTAGFIIKPPAGSAMDIHRDWTFTDDLSDVVVNVWCPLVAVDETNGALRIVEGSHKLVPNVSCPKTKPFFQDFSESLIKHSIPVPLKAGEVLFFEGSVLHSSGMNNSASARPAVTIMCLPSESRYVFYYPDKNAPSERFEVFEMNAESDCEHSGADYLNGSIKTRSLGFVENKNRRVSEKEFFELLKNADLVRREAYFPDEKIKTGGRFRLFERVRTALGI